jgi:thiol-disulfide isomerase/thioredoxin
MKKIFFIYIIIAVLVIVVAGIYVDKNTHINVGQNVPTQINSQSTASPGSQNTSTVNQNSATPQASNSVKLSDYGKAPDFKTGDTWLNSQPLSITGLRGKVVLVDFWTYSCINCIRTLPYVTKWYDTYKDNGLVVVGVHTPEFVFEHDTNNVKNAISQFNIHYPVVQDNDYGIWDSYSNEYWPAEYLINQKGEIVEEHFGEGNYDTTENTIRELLGLNATSSVTKSNNLDKVGSPEMYFGTDRLQYLTPDESTSLSPKNYTANNNVALNNFSLGGQWQFSGTNAQLVGSSGKIILKFNSGKVFIVAASQTPAPLSIIVDGKKQSPVTVQSSKLYTLFNSEDYSDHVIEIDVNQSGFQAFTFTFG